MKEQIWEEKERNSTKNEEIQKLERTNYLKATNSNSQKIEFSRIVLAQNENQPDFAQTTPLFANEMKIEHLKNFMNTNLTKYQNVNKNFEPIKHLDELIQQNKSIFKKIEIDETEKNKRVYFPQNTVGFSNDNHLNVFQNYAFGDVHKTEGLNFRKVVLENQKGLQNNTESSADKNMGNQLRIFDGQSQGVLKSVQNIRSFSRFESNEDEDEKLEDFEIIEIPKSFNKK